MVYSFSFAFSLILYSALTFIATRANARVDVWDTGWDNGWDNRVEQLGGDTIGWDNHTGYAEVRRLFFYRRSVDGWDTGWTMGGTIGWDN